MFLTYRGELDYGFSPSFYITKTIIIKNAKKLKTIAFINPSRAKPQFSLDDKVPYIGLPETGLGKVNEVVYRKYKDVGSRTLIKKNDILFARIEPSVFNKKYIYARDINNHQFAFSSTEFYIVQAHSINQDFLYKMFFTEYVFNQIQGKTTGSTGRRRLSRFVFENLYIPVPDNKTQDKIVKILNFAEQLLKNGQHLRKNLGKSFLYFLKTNNVFLPVFKIKNPRIIPNTIIENALNVERYAFTYKLDNPENWQTLKEVGTTHIQTLTPSKGENKEKIFTLLRIDDLPKKPFKAVSRTVQGIEVDGNIQHIMSDDVLVSRLAPTIRNKKIIVAPKSDLPIIGSNEFIRLTCNEENNPVFVCYLLRTKFYTELMLSKSRGSTPSRYRLSRADFEKLPFPKVPKPIQDNIAKEYLKNIEEAQHLIQKGKEAVKKAKAEVERMILGEDSI